MFSVIFEVHPRTEQWDNYLANAKMLRPELENVDGFLDNIRYRSLTREGWILSVSSWRDEKAVVRWRTRMRHHEAQERGRTEIFLDYHLRVGQLTKDTNIPEGYELLEKLGSGGMGIVYKAQQVGLKRTVALKMIQQEIHTHPEARLRFKIEAEAVQWRVQLERAAAAVPELEPLAIVRIEADELNV